MIFSNTGFPEGTANIDRNQYDPYASNLSIGGYELRRAKRSGRNPVTGARGSRFYGIAVIWTTGFGPLTDVNGNPIY